MAETINHPGNYQIEVSGWGLDNAFFVEKTVLSRSQSGGKQVLLHRALLEGTIIFIRPLALDSPNGSMPVAYQVKDIKPVDSNGQCELRLLRVRPRIKAPIGNGTASYVAEDSLSTCEPSENSIQREHEEILI